VERVGYFPGFIILKGSIFIFHSILARLTKKASSITFNSKNDPAANFQRKMEYSPNEEK
jgi:hypothetical protein